jgi:nicotinamidase-related amidase
MQYGEIMINTALIVIDVQKGFDAPSWGERNNLNAESRIAELISAWRARGMPIVHVQHCSTEPDSPLRPNQSGNEFKDIAQPEQGEKHITKTVNSAFIGTGLEQYLRSNEISNIVITGLTTDHCISTTTRMAGNLGFDVTLVSDATATFNRIGHNGKNYSADEIHDIHLASLNGEFCVVQTTEEVLSSIA